MSQIEIVPEIYIISDLALNFKKLPSGLIDIKRKNYKIAIKRFHDVQNK